MYSILSWLNVPFLLDVKLKERQNKAKRKHSADGDELLAKYMAIKGVKAAKDGKKSKKKLPDDEKSLLLR